MTTKTRIKQLEKARGEVTPLKYVCMVDADTEGGLTEFDGVKMTQSEADKLAAALPAGVGLIHIVWGNITEMDKDKL